MSKQLPNQACTFKGEKFCDREHVADMNCALLCSLDNLCQLFHSSTIVVLVIIMEHGPFCYTMNIVQPDYPIVEEAILNFLSPVPAA